MEGRVGEGGKQREGEIERGREREREREGGREGEREGGGGEGEREREREERRELQLTIINKQPEAIGKDSQSQRVNGGTCVSTSILTPDWINHQTTLNCTIAGYFSLKMEQSIDYACMQVAQSIHLLPLQLIIHETKIIVAIRKVVLES